MGYMNQTAALNTLDNFEQNLASFLLARGDYAWLGTGCESHDDLSQDFVHGTFLTGRCGESDIGCGPGGRLPYCGPDGRSPNCTTVSYLRPPALDLDYGIALGLCEEQSDKPGVFTRKYKNAEALLDCNQWQANITMKTNDP